MNFVPSPKHMSGYGITINDVDNVQYSTADTNFKPINN